MGEEGLIRREFAAGERASGSPLVQAGQTEHGPNWPASRLPASLMADLRTDHAGESGAVMIYRGILAVTRDPKLRAFASDHLATESRHLACIEDIVPTRWRSVLLPVWRLAGWLTGALPALAGARAVYATIQAVETFVDRHYAAQIEWIDYGLQSLPSGGSSPPYPPEVRDALASVRERLEACRLDEVSHRDDAAGRWSGKAGALLGAWLFCVSAGSDAAVRICRKL
jgi:ubiquinone biosynthesis monooxygenase Coq7